MDEEFESFIVDPDLVDPELDISGLRTATDTRPELLFDLPEFSGIRVDPTRRSYIEDMYRAYAGQIPMLDLETPAPAVPPATGGGDAGSGDGGQATTPVDTTPIDTSIIDEGIQSAEDDKGDVMLEDFEMANMGGITSDPIQMENIASNPYDIPMNIDDPGASIENLIAQNPSGTIGGPSDVFDINERGDPTTTMLDVPTNTVGLAYTGEFDPDDEGTVFDTSITPEDTEESITQKIASFLNVDADKLNKAAVTSALNLVAGKALDTVIPIATVFNLITDPFTKSPEEIQAEQAAARQNIEENKVLSEILEDEVTPQDIIDDRGRGQIPTRTEPEPTPTFEPPRGGGADASQSDFSSGPPSGPGEVSSDAGFSDPSPSRGGGADMGTVDSPVSTAGQAGPPSQRGGGGGGNGGGGGGGGKIVCTMMNESYGFGSFRNKIWLRHSKGLAPEYQRGYHKIFLPLVRLSKKNIVLKKVLEHIAVHRTIDIRQESRGKVHLLGRVYRKILEPICYFIGKHG